MGRDIWRYHRSVANIRVINPNDMKARIDTNLKTIAIEEAVTLDELNKFVKALFPDDWKAWKVETNVKFEFKTTPIYVERYRPWWEVQPVYNTFTTCDADIIVTAGGNSTDINTGVYCLEVPSLQ